MAFPYSFKKIYIIDQGYSSILFESIHEKDRGALISRSVTISKYHGD
ncbi:MAG: hypothetical protein ACJA2S_005183 [Cyclobacteriaceae bacterium]|jgi:hypothetical protein